MIIWTTERVLTVLRSAKVPGRAACFVMAYPAPIRQLARAYALDQLQQEGSAYARTVGAGDNERAATGRAIAALEDTVLRSEYSRQLLMGPV